MKIFKRKSKYKKLKEEPSPGEIKRRDFYPKTGETYKRYSQPDFEGKGYRKRHRKIRKRKYKKVRRSKRLNKKRKIRRIKYKY